MADPTYSKVVEYLNDNFAYWATHVLNLGKPEYTNSIPTAAVALTSDDGDKFTNFSFLFNPDFLAGFDEVGEQAFIFAHETMHILLDHLSQAGRYADFDKIKSLMDKKDTEGLTDDEVARLLVEKKKMECFNIAADCVINDYLTQEGFECPPKIGEDADGNPIELCTGLKEVGHDCSNYTVKEVYDELIQKFSGKDEAQANGGKIDGHDWMFQQAKDAVDAAKKMAADIKAAGDMPDAADLQDGNGKRYSLTADDVAQDFIDQRGVSLAWVKLLEYINPDAFKQIGVGPPKKASFHKKRRKLGGFPSVNLPVKRVDPRTLGETDTIPAMVLALDTSGSISQSDRNKFITLARSVPQERIKLFPITFTTRYKNLDLENPNYESGGTCFSCIQDYILKEVVPVLGHYPKAVCVVTDGEADFSYGNEPSAQQFKSWSWLLTDYAQTYDIQRWTPGKDWKINDFVKRN